jgi:hypothetical protein
MDGVKPVGAGFDALRPAAWIKRSTSASLPRAEVYAVDRSVAA